ncbi:N-methylhydantoinase B [Caballeronia udeis]|uniref:N-methylhydantoinase B n=2 Tax=Caballeronia udeis TaxID=1232866 RepID=A0ABW8MXW2_9BURK
MHTSRTIDMVTFEVLRHRLWEINDEMGLIAARISGSPAVYESGDFNTAILTAEGKGLFTGVYVIRQAAALDVVVQSVLRAFEGNINEGDVFMTNDPWSGALHAMDYAVVCPVFWHEILVAWTGIVMHEMDVGGPRPGSWSVGAATAYEECPLMPPVKIIEAGVFRKDIEAIFLRNTRTPEVNALNLRAKISAQTTTRDRLRDIIREYGLDVFLGVQDQILSHVRQTVRKRLARMPDGEWFATTLLDHDGVQNRLYKMKLAMTKRGDRLTFDFTGTAKQASGSINCAYSGLVGGVTQVLLPLLCFDLPWAHGALVECIDIISEEGTINNCLFPAATSMATLNASQSSGNLVWETMARMYGCSEDLRDEIIGLGYGGANMAVLAGTKLNGRPFVNMFTDSVGGGGARPFGDGVNSCGNLIAPAYGIPNVERIEGLLPVLYVYRKERKDTAGAGIHRGGVSLEYMIAPHGAGSDINAVFFATGYSHSETKGVAGGLPGSIQRNFVLRNTDLAEKFNAGRLPGGLDELASEKIEVPEAKDVADLGASDAWINFCSGGGGYGDPLMRQPDQVLRDVRLGFCSVGEAEILYGVSVVEGPVTRIDEAATTLLRRKTREDRMTSGVRLGNDWDDDVPFNGAQMFRVGETLAVRASKVGPLLGCTNCDRSFGPASEDPRQRALMLESPLSSLSESNRYLEDSNMVVRRYCCPGCGTIFSTDVQQSDDDPRTPEMRLRFDALIV